MKEQGHGLAMSRTSEYFDHIIHPELILLNSGPENEINLFIHGYNAINSEKELDLLIKKILATKPPGKVYLLLWESGEFFTEQALKKNIIIRNLLKLLPLGLFRLFKNYFNKEGSISYELAKFKLYEYLAIDLGNNLKEYLTKKIPNCSKIPMNMIGHSMGGLIIMTSLETENWRGFKLKDCVLFGSASILKPIPSQCFINIKGKIYNFYSKEDILLALPPEFRRRAGRHPYPKHKKVINRAFSYTHTEYWSRLPDLFSHWKRYKPSHHYQAELECPSCKKEVIIDGNGNYRCPHCRNEWEFYDGFVTYRAV